MQKSRSKKLVNDHESTDDDEDDAIDFSNAVLYVGALQTIMATAAASVVSIVSCWILPVHAISAVRTLVLACIVSAILVRKPFRLGRVHGLGLIFNALRPCVGIYIVSMVLEQLVHTCTRDAASPSWRRMVFHLSVLVAMLSGFARARRPLEQTDVPFLVTGLSLLVIAMLPPPAVILAGPLCSEPTFNSSAERLTRALVFSLLYCTFVYASAPPVQSSGEVIVCVMRASAASLWTLGCHILLLPLAFLQCGVVIYVRIYSSEYAVVLGEDAPIVANMSDDDDPERGMSNGKEIGTEMTTVHPVLPIDSCLAASMSTHNGHKHHPNSDHRNSDHRHKQTTCAVSEIISPVFSALGPRTLVDISSVGSVETHNGHGVANCACQEGATGIPVSTTMSKQRMAEIAATMDDDG